MRKTFLLTFLMFLVGVLAGTLDGRPNHLAVPAASAMIKSGGGGGGGCDGLGAPPICANCTGTSGGTCTHGLCVGYHDCKDGPAPNGNGSNWCYGIGSGCASGGTTVGKVQ